MSQEKGKKVQMTPQAAISNSSQLSVENAAIATTLEQGLALFETAGMPARNLSARTRREYKNNLTDLVVLLAERGVTETNNVSVEDLERYQAEMDRRG